MDFQAIIAKRRDGLRHTREEIEYVSEAAAKGLVPDYQLSAWLMAAYLNPLDEEETAWLTLAMANSGERIDLTGLPKPWVDKHSTGGVGDKTTMVLLPLLASCGLTMVKMSGKGLGITGGTVDKLSSMPGFRLDLSPTEMKAQASKIGLALTGASPALAPADKALYALRDATATVRSMPLIVSSILSKKIAGGAETVVLDVKCGSGAFMKTLDEARQLAEMLVRTAEKAGLKVRAVITDMDQPLGAAVGNANELGEALSILTYYMLPPEAKQELDRIQPRLRFQRLCIELAGITLEAAGVAESHQAGRSMAEEALASGRAHYKMHEWFEAQRVAFDRDAVPDHNRLPSHSVRHEGEARWVRRVDAGVVGQAVVDLGGGRKHKDDEIHLGVGLDLDVGVGQKVESGDPLFTVHAKTAIEAVSMSRRVHTAFEFSSEPVPEPPLILDVL